MASFPLLKLPFLAQKEIILQMDLNVKDLVELSIFSTKVKKLFGVIKFDVARLEYSFGEDGLMAMFINTTQMKFVSIRVEFGTKVKQFSNRRNVDGKSIYTDRGSYFILGISENNSDNSKLDILESFTRHLLSFLKVKRFELSFRQNVGLKELFIWKYVPHFDEIQIGPNPNYSHWVSTFRHSLALTSKDLIYILENVSTDLLFLDVYVGNEHNFKCHFQNLDPSMSSGSPKIQKIRLSNLSWVDMDTILDTDFKSIVIRIEDCGTLRKVLNQWINGMNDQLDEFIFLTSKKFTIQEVFQGINATSSVFTNAQDARDIRRIHDGCMATVVITSKRVGMVVWNEKNLAAIRST